MVDEPPRGAFCARRFARGGWRAVVLRKILSHIGARRCEHEGKRKRYKEKRGARVVRPREDNCGDNEVGVEGRARLHRRRGLRRPGVRREED